MVQNGTRIPAQGKEKPALHSLSHKYTQAILEYGAKKSAFHGKGTQRRTRKATDGSADTQIGVLLIQLCPRTRGGLEGERTCHPSREAGLSTQEVLHPPSSHCRLEMPLFRGDGGGEGAKKYRS